MAARKDVQRFIAHYRSHPRVAVEQGRAHYKVKVEDGRLVAVLSIGNRRSRTPGGDMTQATKAVERAIRGEAR